MSTGFTPKGFSQSDDLEDDSILLIKNLMANNKTVKPMLGGNDKTANRDGIIELRNATHPVGKIDVQVKPIDATRKKSGKICYQLPGHMVAYSEIAGGPFILICYDREASKAYWKLINKSLLPLFKEGAGSATLEFLPEDEIDDSQPYAKLWLQIIEAHLASMKMFADFNRAFDILKADKSFSTNLDSPNDLVELVNRLISVAGVKYKTRLEEAQKCFNKFEIAAASDILEELAAELDSNEAEKSTYFDVLIWLGNCRYRLEKMKPAEEAFRKALAIDKDSPRAQTNMGHILYVQNINKAEALAFAEAGWKSRPEHEPSLGVYMMCLNFTKSFSKLDALMKDKSAILEKSAELQLCLGQMVKENDYFQKACEHFRNVFTIDADYHHARLLFAECAYRLVRKGCLELLDAQKAPDPEVFKSDLDEALGQLKTAIDFFTGTTDRLALHRGYDIHASINMLRGNFDEALSDCAKMDAIQPGKVEGAVLRAQVYMQLGRFEDIITSLEPHAKLDRIDVVQVLGYSHYRLNHWKEAAECFQKYVTIEESLDGELLPLVQCLWFSGKKREAYLLAQKLRKAGRATKEIIREVELAWLRESNQWFAGSDVVEDLIKIAPDDAEFYLHQISINIERKQQVDAQKNYENFPRRLLDSDPWAKGCFKQQEQLLRQLRWIK